MSANVGAFDRLIYAEQSASNLPFPAKPVSINLNFTGNSPAAFFGFKCLAEHLNQQREYFYFYRAQSCYHI